MRKVVCGQECPENLRGTDVLEQIYLLIEKSNKNWTAQEIADTLGVSLRVVQYSIKELNDIKIPAVDMCTRHRPHVYFKSRVLNNFFGWTDADDGNGDVEEVEAKPGKRRSINDDQLARQAILNV